MYGGGGLGMQAQGAEGINIAKVDKVGIRDECRTRTVAEA